MLIYDHNKEFIGIDQVSLKLLGYTRFEDLIHEHKDVAELFVKKPGYIHNFTNFPWIDFVLHAESDDAKVIIAGKNKAFAATIEIIPLFLEKAPDQEAFLINLKNIHDYQLDASERPEPTPAPFDLEAKEFNTPAQEPVTLEEPAPEPFVAKPVETPSFDQGPLTLDEDIFIQDEPEAPELNVPETPAPTPHKPVEDEEELDIFFHGEEPEFQEPRIEEAPEFPQEEQSIFDNIEEEHEAPMLGAYLSDADREYLADLEVSDDYVYDPQIAADELGLPVDLIEEFIGDFIKQAHEFKDQLFNAIKDGDFDNIKVLSHKLKGVAANLRIEDAFEVLKNVNESSDLQECEANLKKFYMTIGKLEGKDIEEIKRELDKPEEELYDLTPSLVQVQEEKSPEETTQEEPAPQPLDLPDLNEDEASAEPLLDIGFKETEPKEETDQEQESAYDYGLAVGGEDAPLVMLEDEEEILNDLDKFDQEPEEELLDDIQNFDTANEVPAESLTPLTFDVNTAAAEIGLSADLVSALIDDYIVEANEMRPKLTEVIDSGDLIRSKGYAVQLKGVSDNLRIAEISDALQKLISSSEENQAKAAMQEFYGFVNQL